MRHRSFLFLILCVLLTSGPLTAEKRIKPLFCGSSPVMDRRELFLHQRASERRADLIRAGRTSINAAGRTISLERSANTVSGDILVMSSDGGVVLSSHPFPASLVNKTISFIPQQASSVSYKVEVSDGAYRSDALGSGSVDLLRPESGQPIGEDDSREFDLPFPFPFHGETHTKLFVNSNGHITFGEADPSYEVTDYKGFLSGPPKIAGASMDLDPSDSPGIASLKVYLTPTEAIISYLRISDYYDFSNQADFQIRLLPSGEISIIHRGVLQEEFVMGITPGGNRDTGRLIQFTNPPQAPLGGSIAEVFTSSQEATIDVFRASEVFFETQPDDYDYLVFFNDADIPAGSLTLAYAINVRNQVQGIGDDEIDFGPLFGSAKRLQTVLNMGPLSQYPNEPDAPLPRYAAFTPLSLLAHEAGHRFLATPLLREGNQNTRNLLGRQLAHWSFTFNSHASFMEGNELTPVPDTPNRFRTGRPYQRFSELDRYLMGLIPAHEVGLEQQLFYVNNPSLRTSAPLEGFELVGSRRDFSIDDIIAANGVRVPDHTISQKRFRLAFVLVTNDPEKAAPSVAKLDKLRRAFIDYFLTQTLGRVVVDASLKPALDLSVFPAIGIPVGYSGDLKVTRRQNSAAEVPLAFETEGNSILLQQTPAALPAHALEVQASFVALAPGITKLRVSSADDSHQPAEASAVVESFENLRLELLTPSRVAAQPNTEIDTPIRLRVVNAQQLRFRGVTLRFEPLTGGSVTPELATTDELGEAAFHWTVGNRDSNAARIYIEGFANQTEVVVTALADLNPDLRAATNAASYEPGISPDGLATLFGVSLSGGRTSVATTLPLPTELEGVSVVINGQVAPLVYVADQQINLYVPSSVSGNTALIQITTKDGQSQMLETPLKTWQPGIFFDPGTNLGAILRTGSTQKTDVVPVPPGDHMEIYATGLGPVVAEGRGIYRTQSLVKVRLAGQELISSFSGLAPGFSGLYQVNVMVPESLEPGTYELQVEVEGETSNTVNVVVGTPSAP